MKLSAFSVVDAFPPELSAGRDRWREVVELGRACERGGLSALWIAEHHFQPGGLCPAPPVLLAALAERTRRLRLGVLVSVLPFHRPIELAEQYALVDQLSDGRLNLGLGSGYIPLEFEGFGIDPAEKRERFDRGFETLLRALHGEAISPEGGGGAPVRINVEPRQKPHPPLWIAVQRREALPYVARKRTSVALIPYATVESLEDLAEEIREFRAAVPEDHRAEVAVGLHLYAGEHPRRAREALQRYLDARLRTQSSFFEAQVRRDPRRASAEAIEDADFALFGPAAEVRERLEAFRRAGVDEVLGLFDFGGLPLDDVTSSVESLGRAFPRSGGA